jgi:hypothetical protein
MNIHKIALHTGFLYIFQNGKEVRLLTTNIPPGARPTEGGCEPDDDSHLFRLAGRVPSEEIAGLIAEHVRPRPKGGAEYSDGKMFYSDTREEKGYVSGLWMGRRVNYGTQVSQITGDKTYLGTQKDVFTIAIKDKHGVTAEANFTDLTSIILNLMSLYLAHSVEEAKGKFWKVMGEYISMWTDGRLFIRK